MYYKRKWKPSRTQRREFAIKMQTDPEFAEDYNERKRTNAEKRRSKSKFDYNSAGGCYVPTKYQYDFCFEHYNNKEITTKQKDAFDNVMSAYLLNEKTHHDNIHIVNELIRSGIFKTL